MTEPFNLYHIEQAAYGIPHIARRYIEILKRHQPEGSYILGGWCYSGMITHEMACQLQNSGEAVKYLHAGLPRDDRPGIKENDTKHV